MRGRQAAAAQVWATHHGGAAKATAPDVGKFRSKCSLMDLALMKMLAEQAGFADAEVLEAFWNAGRNA